MFSNLSDKELLRHKDERAFKVLYNRYWSLLYKKALARLGNEEDTKDILQEIFISIWNNRFHIVLEDSIAAYIFTALKYSSIKKVERDYKKGIMHPLNIEAIEHVFLTDGEKIHFKELEKIIDREVALLPEKMKQIYLLSRQNQLKNKEIAVKLQISEQTVKNSLSIAIKKLRSKLSDYQFSIFLI